jgi:multidrug efflux pump subunit AcrA (membrane-fusion protein)
MQKSYIKANANGYLRSSFTQPGQYVNAGQVLFTITTKEAQSIGNAVNKLDSGFRFSGVNTIKAAGRGFITQLNHQPGDYVQDGDQLAVISDLNSFAFLLDLPYELRPYVEANKTVSVILPDSETLTGTISRALPAVDPASQTQSLVIKVNVPHAIPENLVAKVRMVKIFKAGAASLPKAAVLADETQTSFWIMKMTDSVTAVKVPVTKGIETNDRIEIIAPTLTTADRILVTGNYGLADTAKVKIIK